MSHIVVFALACMFTAGTVGGASAEVASRGRFVHDLNDARFIKPTGRYRTRLGWVIASLVEWRSNPPLLDLLARIRPNVYRQALGDQVAYFKRLSNPNRYLYRQALLRDLASLQIAVLASNRLSYAIGTVLQSALVDTATSIVFAGISDILPADRAAIVQLYTNRIRPDDQARAVARGAFADLEMRYRGLVGPSVFRDLRARLQKIMKMSAPTENEITKLVAESLTSAGAGTWASAYRKSPALLVDQWRRQVAMDVAAWRCGCALDPKIFAPQQVWIRMFGGLDTYRTRLGYLISLKLAPPSTTITNVLSGGTTSELLQTELAKVAKLRSKNSRQYLSYLRSFLVDLEVLETEMLQRTQSSTAAQFAQSVVANAIFGSFAIGYGVRATALTILANASHGGVSDYEALGEKIKIRVEVAALRETLLDQLTTAGNVCACGAGVLVAPDRVIKGKKRGSDKKK